MRRRRRRALGVGLEQRADLAQRRDRRQQRIAVRIDDPVERGDEAFGLGPGCSKPIWQYVSGCVSHVHKHRAKLQLGLQRFVGARFAGPRVLERLWWLSINKAEGGEPACHQRSMRR